jgi:hypothetical protein
MNCKDIENILPLYPDDLLTASEKQDVEEHLKFCQKCHKEFVSLQKTGKMVEELKAVEPPPWFEQQIMAKIRQEADKKDLMKKWFYPLRIKKPVQIFATIIITVLAVYVYRTGEQDMKAVLMPKAVPVIEVRKEPASIPSDKQIKQKESYQFRKIKEKVAAREGINKERGVVYDLSPIGGASSMKAEEENVPLENKQGAEDCTALAEKREAARAMADVGSKAMLSARQEAPAKAMAAPVMESKSGAAGLVASRRNRLYKAVQPVAPQPMMAGSLQRYTIISIYVTNIETAVSEAEKILRKYDAHNIAKPSSAVKANIMADITAQNIKDLMEQLKTIGRVEERTSALENKKGNIPVRIEFIRE